MASVSARPLTPIPASRANGAAAAPPPKENKSNKSDPAAQREAQIADMVDNQHRCGKGAYQKYVNEHQSTNEAERMDALIRQKTPNDRCVEKALFSGQTATSGYTGPGHFDKKPLGTKPKSNDGK